MTGRNKTDIEPETNPNDRNNDDFRSGGTKPSNDRGREDDEGESPEIDDDDATKPRREPYIDPSQLPGVREPTPDPSEQDHPDTFPEDDRQR